jgi:hypothetical protein
MKYAKPSPSDPAFHARKNVQRAPGALTSERIASDLDAFCAAGGSIEVLTITRPKDRADEPDAPPMEPVQPPRLIGRSRG